MDFFINNQTRNNTFGISKVSNYLFSYNLLAQSASSGILSQQFVIAEGGFKSLLMVPNQWLISSNVDAHVENVFLMFMQMLVYIKQNA